MKIGILTHYQVESHGACLQHYALTQYLREKGHEVYSLSYEKSFEFANQADRKKFSVGLTSIPFYLKEYLVKKGPDFVITMAKKHRLLGKFNKENFSFLPCSDCGADIAIIGSDEVWSLQFGANKMMYGYGVDAQRCISYAPSFGQTDFTVIGEHNCRDMIANGLSGFSHISARDLTSQKMAAELTGRDVELVCDPVLLYGFEKELEKAVPMTKEKYVAVYAYNSDMNEPDRIESIRAYARKIGAKVYSIGAFHKWCDKQIACDPIEMMYWFKGAQAVFTDTFHGTITSYLTKTPMAVYVRTSNNVKLEHLLQVLGLESRKVSSDRTIYEILTESIDFSKIKENFEPFRVSSAAYLDEALDSNN